MINSLERVERVAKAFYDAFKGPTGAAWEDLSIGSDFRCDSLRVASLIVALHENPPADPIDAADRLALDIVRSFPRDPADPLQWSRDMVLYLVVRDIIDSAREPA